MKQQQTCDLVSSPSLFHRAGSLLDLLENCRLQCRTIGLPHCIAASLFARRCYAAVCVFAWGRPAGLYQIPHSPPILTTKRCSKDVRRKHCSVSLRVPISTQTRVERNTKATWRSTNSINVYHLDSLRDRTSSAFGLE